MNTLNIYNSNRDNDKNINLDTNSNTKIKICGLTSPAEAQYLNENHVDFAGMVLFFQRAREIYPSSRQRRLWLPLMHPSKESPL